MKNLFMLPCAAIAMALCSCTAEESNSSFDFTTSPIKVNVSISDLQTRAGRSSENVTEFYMGIKNASNSKYSYDAKLKYADLTWTSYTHDGTSKLAMYWADATTPVTVTSSTFDITDNTASLSASTTQTAETLVSDDHLLQVQENVKPSAEGINVTFAHVMAKVNLKVTLKGYDSSTNPISDVTIEGTVPTGTLTVAATPSWSVSGTASAITPYNSGFTAATDAADPYAQYEAVVVPQTVSNFAVNFKVGDKTYKWTSPSAVTLEPGTAYNVELDASKSVVTLKEMKVADWNASSNTISGEVSEVEQTTAKSRADAATHTVYLVKEGDLTTDLITTAIGDGTELNISGKMNSKDWDTFFNLTYSTLTSLNMTNVELSDVTSLDKHLINNSFQNLETIILPSAIQAIASGAFSSLYSLKSITFLGNVKSFASIALNCYNLTTLDLSYCDTAPTLEDNVFQGLRTRSVTVYVKDDTAKASFESKWGTSEVSGADGTTFTYEIKNQE